ncbi:hypothetical protein ACJ41O_008828 [Fusarium nematophilum]
MSEANDQRPSNPDALVGSNPPSWLTLLERRIEEEKDEVFPDPVYFEIVRDVLAAPEGDDTAVSRAIARFHEHYVSGFAGEDFGRRTPPDYSAEPILQDLANLALEVSAEIEFTDERHDRLANLLIGIKESSAKEFNKDDPKFVFYPIALRAAAAEYWNGGHAALLAKWFKGDLLETDGRLWVSGDFEKAFEIYTQTDVVNNLGKKAEVLAVANYILFAGDAYINEVKNPSRWYHVDVTPQRWTLWASKLQEVADAVGEDAEWDLKNRAQKAHDRMVELYPEAFQ